MLQPHTSTAVPAIVPLPPAACAQVRSQVVVASVAAALGEVVANALDAGATEVHVELALQPDSLGFRVADTGHGIPAASLALLGQRFATSKRAGSGAAPRGEGLAAIREAATAVEVTTRAAGSFETFAVTLRPGGQAPRTQLALEQRSRQGTVVTVRSLFAAQPVRLKALLAAGLRGEADRCHEVVLRAALLRPGVAFTLFDHRRRSFVLRMLAGRSQRDSVAEFLGHPPHLVAAVVQPPALVGSAFAVSGFAALPPHGHPSRRLQCVYVNGRWVQAAPLNQLADQVFQQCYKSALRLQGAAGQELQQVHKAANAHATFVLHISCSPCEYELARQAEGDLVEFRSWGALLEAVQHTLLATWRLALPNRLLKELEALEQAANSDSRGQRASGGGRLLPGAKHALVSRLVRYNSATAAPAQRSWAAGAPGSGTSTAHIGIHYAAQQLGDMQAYETRPWHPGGPASCGGQVLASLVPWQQQANQQQQQQQWLPDAAAGTPPWDLTGPLDGGRRSGNDWALQDPQPVNPLQDARWAQPSREGEAGLCALSYRPPQHQASGRSEGRQTYSVLTAEEQALLRSAAAAGPGQAGRQRAQSAPPHARLRRRVPPIRQPRFTAAPALVAVSGEGSGATAAAAIPSAPACAAVQQEAPLRAAGRPVPSFLHPGAGGLGELLGPWRRPGRKAAAARPSAVAAAPALGGAGFAGPSILTLEALSAAVFAQLKPASLSRQQLGAARALCQVDSKFVPIMHGSLLALVDQHAADERVQLERLRGELLGPDGQPCPGATQSQALRAALPLDLTVAEQQLLEAYQGRVEAWGWRCALPQGRSSVTLLTHVPLLWGATLSATDLKIFLHHLHDTCGAGGVPAAVVRVLNGKACRSSLMFGDPLAPAQCQALLDSLACTRLCFSCAHGRPTTAPVVDLHLLRQALRLRAQAQQVGGGSSEAAGSTGVGLAGLRAKLKGLVG